MTDPGRPAWVDDERFPFESRFADHRTVVIEGAGHFVQSDAPDRFATAIRASRYPADGVRE